MEDEQDHGESTRLFENFPSRSRAKRADADIVIVPPFTAIPNVEQAQQSAARENRRAKHALGKERRFHRRSLRPDAPRIVRALCGPWRQRARQFFGETDEIVNQEDQGPRLRPLLTSDRLHRRNARRARSRQGRAEILAPASRQPRRPLPEGTAAKT